MGIFDFLRRKKPSAEEVERRIAEEVRALERMRTYKEKTREELLEEVRRRRAGREFARGVEEEARFVATRGLPAPVDVKSLFLAGNRREAAKIMMRRGMSGKEIEDMFSDWSRGGGGEGPSILGYPAPEPKALPAVATRGEDLAEKLIEDFRQGKITGDAARRGVADLVRRGWISVDEANATLERISRMRDSEGRVIVPRYPPAEGRAKRFVEAGFQSTAQGGLRPTARQLRAPLYGKVRNTATQMQKLDPEVRSAINKARLELQKKSRAIKEEFDRETSRIKSESQPIEVELKRLRDALEKTNREINEELTKEESPAKQQGEGGAMGGLGG